MSETKQIVALSVGAQRVTMGVFARSGKSGLTMSRYGSRNIVLDIAAEGLRLNQISEAVGELVQELQVKGSTVFYDISGQQVFIRFVKLPIIAGTDIDQLVRFEAQQHVPFPMDEVIWHYHLLPDMGIGEREAVLVAIKAELLDALNNEICGRGLTTGGVDCTLTAIYNSYRDSYPDANGAAMIIDIGAKTTNLIYCEGERFFTRSITAGGVFITSSISRELNIPFAQAEEIKLTHGMVSMTNGQTDGMSEDQAVLATTIRNAMTRLASEVQRTTNHYRAQYKGSAPTQVYLCGGGALLPYTREFLEERLGVPVDFFNPLHRIGVGSAVDTAKISRDAVTLGGVVGVALGAVGRGSIKIDLVPTTVLKQRNAKKIFPKVLAGVIVAIVGAGIYTYSNMSGVDKVKSVARNVSKVLHKAEAQKQVIDKIDRSIKAYDKKIEALNILNQKRYSFLNVVRMLTLRTPNDGYWISDMEPLMKFDPTNMGMSGEPVVSKSFLKDAESSLAKPAPETDVAARKGRPGQVVDPNAVEINAMRLVGFVRYDKGGEKLIPELQKKIKEVVDDSPFIFTFDGKPLEDKQVFKMGETDPAKPTFAQGFTLILPLKTSIKVK